MAAYPSRFGDHYCDRCGGPLCGESGWDDYYCLENITPDYGMWEVMNLCGKCLKDLTEWVQTTGKKSKIPWYPDKFRCLKCGGELSDNIFTGKYLMCNKCKLYIEKKELIEILQKG